MNNSAKFLLHPPYGFRGDDFILAFRLPWQPIKFRGFDKIHILKHFKNATLDPMPISCRRPNNSSH